MAPPDEPGDPDDGAGDGGENEPIRVPTPERKLRVAIVGDSLAGGLGYFAERVFRRGS